MRRTPALDGGFMEYGREFYDSQAAGSLRSARVVIPLLMDLAHPRTVVDFGCGVGTWLKVFKENGVEQISGYDGPYVSLSQLLIPHECFHPADFENMDVASLPRADLAASFEVAEHLEPSGGERLIKALVTSSDLVAFSAAVPKQGGCHHVNEQWPPYWAERFAQHDYEQFDLIRPRIWDNPEVDPWYRQNIFLYARRNQPIWQKLRSMPQPFLREINVIHPEQFSRLVDIHQRASQLGSYSGRELLRAALKRAAGKIGLNKQAS